MNFSIDPTFSPSNFPSSQPFEWQSLTPPLFPDYLEYCQNRPLFTVSTLTCCTVSSSSLSDRSSSISPLQSNVSSPDALHVTCDLPLVAPTPIPFHVRDLANFDSANTDYNVGSLSLRPSRYHLKRNRADDGECHQRISRKRSALLAPWPSNPRGDVSRRRSDSRTTASRTKTRGARATSETQLSRLPSYGCAR